MKPSPWPWRWEGSELVDANRETLLALDDDVDYPIPGGHEGTTSEPPREVLALTALAPEMREMLLKLEWGDYTDIDEVPVCPSCVGVKRKGHHDADCTLGALLEKLR